MRTIKYELGDATAPVGEGRKIIVHICNDIGGWGKGFVMAISRRWKEPEQEYRKWHASGEGFELGVVQYVQVEEDTWIANIIGQHKLRKSNDGEPPIRYPAVESGLKAISDFAKEINATVHMPRIGCGLAGGNWEVIEKLINKNLAEVDTTVYDFKE